MNQAIPDQSSSSSRSWVAEVFARNVFTRDVMQERLPARVFEKFLKITRTGASLDPTTADIVANAMKDWAIERGATHFCHWFQPLTGLTAEKHDAFISPIPGGGILMRFSGEDLVQGEPDASSFPSGSLRESFEARGYTTWDYTSPVFIKKDGENITMFIPSAFCAYTGESLDYKTPLLRANEALNRQSLRILRALGNKETKRVTVTLGVEQEYFLIDAKFIERRLDLMEAGRTVFGAPSPKGMAMSVHYFGSVHERIASFMHDVNSELWQLGISAKTQHHEISPCQYEIAQVFSNMNVATDHNHLTMETLRKIAERHGLECLLHDKPFATLGGSGKHHNWSLMTDDGANLLEPGETPHENEVFLVFLSAIIRAVDKYPHLLRSSVADAGNDHRLGAMEAPPAIISIFLGDQLDKIFRQLADGDSDFENQVGEKILLGVNSLPPLPKDVTDRNRTSPMAFTGNKFEFRTPGSACSPSRPSFAFATIVADVLQEIADEIESADDVHQATQEVTQRIAREHGRVLFSGDNYSDEWVEEAARRGLPNLPDSVTAYKAVRDKEVLDLFERQKVFNSGEYEARVDTAFRHYAQDLLIEARAGLRMAKTQVLPAGLIYSDKLAESINNLQDAGAACETHRAVLEEVSPLIDQIHKKLGTLRDAIDRIEAIEEPEEQATGARDHILPALGDLRESVDALEQVVDAELWPLPNYAQMVHRH